MIFLDLGPVFPRGLCVFVGVLWLGFAAGCADLTTINPSFDTPYAEARRTLEAMRDEPKTLERPLIFVGPFIDPGFAEWGVVSQARRVVDNPDQVAGVSFVAWDTFDLCRDKTLRVVDRAFPSADPVDTVEVDVIAFSMGGLVARYAALPPPPPPEDGSTAGSSDAPARHRRLKINRLYTIASPHRGADWAPLGVFNALAQDMRAGSAFLARLDAGLADADYELIPYTRLGDAVVGVENTAPPGVTPHWVSTRPFELAHVQAAFDARILSDIFRDLRGEDRLADEARAPLPAFAAGDEP